MFVEWKSGLVLPQVITIFFPEWCSPLANRVFLTVMGFHKCVVLGHAVDLSICAAVACCNCSCWLSSEAYNGLWGCLLWAVAVHLADALWHLLDTFSTSLWSLKCPALLFLSQEKKLLREMFRDVVEQPQMTVDLVKSRLLKLQVSWVARLSLTILNGDLWYCPATVNLGNATSALAVPFLWPAWVPLLWSRHGWNPTKCWRKEVCFSLWDKCLSSAVSHCLCSNHDTRNFPFVSENSSSKEPKIKITLN